MENTKNTQYEKHILNCYWTAARRATVAMNMNLPWLLWLPVAVACGGPECLSIESTSLVQTRLQLEPHPKPWEVYDYMTANYHKTGVYLTTKIHYAMFKILGAGEDVMGKLEYPCYYGPPLPMCWNEEAPIIVFTDGFNASWKATHPRSKTVLVAGSVRDPLQMVASAYCYHHEGKEMINTLMPVLELPFLGPEEGTALTAEYMLPIIESMASIFAEPDNNTLRLKFEELTETSEGFDRGVALWLDHYFPNHLISMEQRSAILEAVQEFDENRNPSTDYNVFNSLSTNHSSDPTCKEKASEAVLKIETSLLKRYQELQMRLGYPVGP